MGAKGTRANRVGFWKRGGRRWYTIDPVTGLERSTGYTDIDAAKAWKADRERRAANPKAYALEATTLGDECRRMIDALKSAGRSPDYYEGKLANWVDVLGNDFPLARVDPDAFDRFIKERRSDRVTDHTIDKELKCMITTLHFAKRAGRYQGDTTLLRPLGFSAGYVPRTRALTVAELGKLFAVLEPEALAFVALCVSLGLRRGEALALQPRDVDQVAWVVQVSGTKTEGSLRAIPVLEPFRALVAMAAQRLPLGLWARSNYYTRSLAKSCREAGIPKFTANDLRRTHATLLRSAKVDVDTARRLLGHTPGSQLLEAVYDKPQPLELAARAGDLSELSANIQIISESWKAGGKSPTYTDNTHESTRPWGPVSSPTPSLPPSITRGNDAGGGQEPPIAAEKTWNENQDETDFAAALAEGVERADVFALAARPIRKAESEPTPPSDRAAGGGS